MAEIENTSIYARLTEKSPMLDLSVCDFQYDTISGETKREILEKKTGP